MARSAHPDSAGSQFFVCLTREHCRHLDKQYTAFGKVTSGMDAIEKIAATPLKDPRAGTPAKAPKMVKVTANG
jgi:peptidyl-prolyl cis-trans isomerase B (cyclophilin B)